MSLSVKSFFSYYIVDPLSNDLGTKEKMITMLFSIILAPLIFFHIVGKCLHDRKIIHLTSNLYSMNAKRAREIKKTDHIFKKVISNDEFPLESQKQVAKIISEGLVKPFYAQVLPKKEDVTVPFNGKSTKWKDLTTEEKYEVNNKFAHPHNKLDESQMDEEVVDKSLFAEGQEVYIKNDPREHHGQDHAIRASLFAAAFLFLYSKYHPSYSFSSADLKLVQIVAAGHDCGRQTEGVDVYDDMSAEVTVKLLESNGVTDIVQLSNCRQAIEEKDSKDFAKKSWIAKCVQNADSADFARLFLKSPTQSEDEFEKSRGYLDIFNEIAEVCENDSEAVLKDELTFADFTHELDTLRIEINQFIYKTHRKEMREQFAQSDNYYSELIRQVTEGSFPYLDGVLKKVGIKELNVSTESIILTHINTVLNRTPLADISFIMLQSYIEKLEEIPEEPQVIVLKAKLATEVNRRNQLAPLDAQESTEIEDLHKSVMKALESKDVELLLETTESLLLEYNTIQKHLQDPRMLTSCSLAFERAAHISAESGELKKAEEILQRAGLELPIDTTLKVFDIQEFLKNDEEKIEGEARFIEKDCGFLRKRTMRVQRKTVVTKKGEEKKQIEVSFELPSLIRERINVYLKEAATVPSVYLQKDGDTGLFHEDRAKKIGNDLLVTFPDSGIEIRIGKDKTYWNQYHMVKVNVPEGTDAKGLHKALSSIGLPMGLMPSRDDDVKNETLAKILAFRFPKLVYSRMPKLQSGEVYDLLTKDQRALVDKDFKNSVRLHHGNGTVEIANPQLAEEAWEKGGRAFGAFIFAGNFEKTSDVLTQILSTEYQSSIERYQNGNLGLGCSPEYNNKVGSANQVFTRLFTKNLFDKETSFDRFAITGPIMLLYDLKAIERMPYSYEADRGGLRNMNFTEKLFVPQKQTPIVFYDGSDRIRDRDGLDGYLKTLESDTHPLRESMFERTIGTEYLQRIVVQNEREKYALMHKLELAGITKIGKSPLSEGIIVSDRLTSEMVDSCGDEKYPSTLDTSDRCVSVPEGIPEAKLYDPVSIHSAKEDFPIGQNKVSEIVQKQFIDKFYATPFPEYNEVTVPHNGKWVKWSLLTGKQKVKVNNKYAHAHGKISGLATKTEYTSGVAANKKLFTWKGQAKFLQHDPRESHGNDHSARTAIFSAVFAYLYNKYHPKCQMHREEFVIAQLAGAGHDSGRQTDGTDVYDDKSAENTLKVLQELGIQDESLLEDAKNAIANKDMQDLKQKSFIAKCVQNADSAEFARISLKREGQDKAMFKEGLKYLNIYQELKELKELKDLKLDRKWEDFLKELTSLRKEMNKLIYQTHSKKFRNESGKKNIYDSILNHIDDANFPKMYGILQSIKVINKKGE